MAFRFREPLPSDFETDEEYKEAMQAYEAALDDYSECYFERSRGF